MFKEYCFLIQLIVLLQMPTLTFCQPVLIENQMLDTVYIQNNEIYYLVYGSRDKNSLSYSCKYGITSHTSLDTMLVQGSICSFIKQQSDDSLRYKLKFLSQAYTGDPERGGAKIFLLKKDTVVFCEVKGYSPKQKKELTEFHWLHCAWYEQREYAGDGMYRRIIRYLEVLPGQLKKFSSIDDGLGLLHGKDQLWIVVKDPEYGRGGGYKVTYLRVGDNEFYGGRNLMSIPPKEWEKIYKKAKRKNKK